jgi:glycosyltransferase involved in cell wall biosynthesis
MGGIDLEQTTVIIPVVDETASLRHLLTVLSRWEFAACIVVVNGVDDGPAALARRMGARIIRHCERVGHDVGRALGAAAAAPGSLLFLDADLNFGETDLLPFIEAVNRGVDIALNRIDPYIHPAARLHPVNAAKRFLNAALGRSDLGCGSLTAVPHAISRRALETLGAPSLSVPPRAMTQAVLAGLTVQAVHAVDVVRPNPQRPGVNIGRSNPVEQLIIGDHLEAISYLVQARGESRGGFSDLWRKRELLP